MEAFLGNVTKHMEDKRKLQEEWMQNICFFSGDFV